MYLNCAKMRFWKTVADRRRFTRGEVDLKKKVSRILNFTSDLLIRIIF